MKYYFEKKKYTFMYELYLNVKIIQHIVISLYFLKISHTKLIKFIE